MEKVDFTSPNKEEIGNVLNNVCSVQNLSLEDDKKEYIVNNIYTAMTGEMKEYVMSAKEIRKELPFIIFDDLSIVPELKLNEKTLIQGVIDLYIITNNNKRVIIDFKSDKVQNEQELIDRYKYQIKMYERGIELNFNEKVDEKYIYSFYLNKLIKVD